MSGEFDTLLTAVCGLRVSGKEFLWLSPIIDWRIVVEALRGRSTCSWVTVTGGAEGTGTDSSGGFEGTLVSINGSTGLSSCFPLLLSRVDCEAC